MQAPVSAALAPKRHYEILDGLRGVAAIMVVMFHTFEAYAGGIRFRQIINHGYLAVDFFFLLSGFVIAYAYDDRLGPNGRMTLGGFFTRRLIRLQPMVILGSVIGACLFYAQQSAMYPLIAHTPVWKLLVVMLVGATLLPLTPALDIRGWQEMHPLNGPAWSLFFEYVANICYALWLHKVSKKTLAVLVSLAGIFMAQYLLFGGRGDLIGGWSIDPTQLHIGFVRLLYPFLAGMLLERLGWRIAVKEAFLVAGLLLVVLLALPRFSGPAHLWVNGLYEMVAVMVLFPVVVAIGAGNQVMSRTTTSVCKFLGGISYPLYITHYPLIYLYTKWAVDDHMPASRGIWVGALLLLTAIAIAYAALKLYDEPVRRWLSRRFLGRATA